MARAGEAALWAHIAQASVRRPSSSPESQGPGVQPFFSSALRGKHGFSIRDQAAGYAGADVFSASFLQPENQNLFFLAPGFGLRLEERFACHFYLS